MKDIAAIGAETFKTKDEVDVPIECINGHDLTRSNAVRIETCKFTSRRRWRCRECARVAASVSREEGTKRAKVMNDAFDEEMLDRLTRISRKNRDITPQDLVRLIVTHAIEQLEGMIEKNAAKKRGPKE